MVSLIYLQELISGRGSPNNWFHYSIVELLKIPVVGWGLEHFKDYILFSTGGGMMKVRTLVIPGRR